MRTSTITTTGGRALTFCEWGDPAGAPVFSLHGTPGSRLTRHPDEGVYTRAGVRAITYDRAGYGGSSRHPGRSVAEAAADVEAIADALGLERFAITGGSGGAPHSLACGSLLSGRVARCASVVGLAPYGPGGMAPEKYFDGMVEGNVREFALAIEGEEKLRPEIERLGSELLESLASKAGDPLGESHRLSDSDMDVLNREDIHTMILESFREGIGRGVDGLVDDDLAFARPWGFDVTAIQIPVAVWYGPDDTLVPRAHGEWLAGAIPGAETVVLDGGHFAIYDRLPQLLAWLTQDS